MDLEKFQVPSEDIAFCFVGKTSNSEVVIFDPWTITGRKFLHLIASRETPDWLQDLDLSRLSRQFINGVSSGRNILSSQLTPQQLTEIRKRISAIQLSDEFVDIQFISV